jgi:two-component system LytT family response regulator
LPAFIRLSLGRKGVSVRRSPASVARISRHLCVDTCMADPLRILLVDDDPIARRGIRRLLPNGDSAMVVGECDNAAQAIDAAGTLSPEVVLLDIAMPGDHGPAVADRLQSADAPYVIFVTAYDRYVVEVFKKRALDYVLKPVASERLGEALNRARAQRDARRMLISASRTNAARAESGSSVPREHLTEIVVRVAMREVVVPVGDIDWIEADSYYARLHVTGREYLLREPLHLLERRLDPAHFVRVHRSAIVNVKRVREVRNERTGERIIALTTGARVRVSRNRWRGFSEHLRERERQHR